MKTLFLRFTVSTVAAVLPLLALSLSPVLAQTKMAAKPMASKATPVYVCKPCKEYFTPAMAKKMNYKDPMGHKLAKMSKAPAGYADASKMGGMGMSKGKM